MAAKPSASSHLASEVRALIDRLRLVEHPEGGWYRESYRSPLTTNTPKGERNLATLIYYLLPQGIVSRVHKVAWDEIWIFHGGGSLRLNLYRGEATTVELLGISENTSPQITIPAETWFNAQVVSGDYVLAACMVAPGFDFQDLEMR